MPLFWNPLRVYAQWREAYLRKNPQKRLFPLLGEISRTSDRVWAEAVEEAGPLISLGPAGKDVVKKGKVVAVLLVLALLASSRSQ